MLDGTRKSNILQMVKPRNFSNEKLARSLNLYWTGSGPFHSTPPHVWVISEGEAIRFRKCRFIISEGEAIRFRKCRFRISEGEAIRFGKCRFCISEGEAIRLRKCQNIYWSTNISYEQYKFDRGKNPRTSIPRNCYQLSRQAISISRKVFAARVK